MNPGALLSTRRPCFLPAVPTLKYTPACTAIPSCPNTFSTFLLPSKACSTLTAGSFSQPSSSLVRRPYAPPEAGGSASGETITHIPQPPSSALPVADPTEIDVNRITLTEWNEQISERFNLVATQLRTGPSRWFFHLWYWSSIAGLCMHGLLLWHLGAGIINGSIKLDSSAEEKFFFIYSGLAIPAFAASIHMMCGKPDPCHAQADFVATFFSKYSTKPNFGLTLCKGSGKAYG